jgi:hypothetical protein
MGLQEKSRAAIFLECIARIIGKLSLRSQFWKPNEFKLIPAWNFWL